MNRWQVLTLRTWAQWVCGGRPAHFSAHGDSIASRLDAAPADNIYRTTRVLWQEGSTDWLFRLDGILRACFTDAELLRMRAAVVPIGRKCTLEERARAVRSTVDELKHLLAEGCRVLQERG